MSHQTPQITLSSPKEIHTSTFHRKERTPAPFEDACDGPNPIKIGNLPSLPTLPDLTIATVREERKNDVLSKLVVKIKRVKTWFKRRQEGGRKTRNGWRDLENGEGGEEMLVLGRGEGGRDGREKPLPALPPPHIMELENGRFKQGGISVVKHSPSRDLILCNQRALQEKPLPPLPPPEREEDGKEMVIFRSGQVGQKGRDKPLPALPSSCSRESGLKMLENGGGLENVKHSSSREVVSFESFKDKPLPALPLEVVEGMELVGGEKTIPRIEVEGGNEVANGLRVWKRVDSAVQGLLYDEDRGDGDGWGVGKDDGWKAECGLEVRGWEMF